MGKDKPFKQVVPLSATSVLPGNECIFGFRLSSKSDAKVDCTDDMAGATAPRAGSQI